LIQFDAVFLNTLDLLAAEVRFYKNVKSNKNVALKIRILLKKISEGNLTRIKQPKVWDAYDKV
jgi:hypothetical protein